ncbi:MAG: MBL fold metallo-hydrolase [Idiomarina sp.]
MTWLSLSKLLTSLIVVNVMVIALPIQAQQSPEQHSGNTPLMEKSSPGYYRMMLGDYEVTALSDGTFGLPAHQLLNGMSEQNIRKQLAVSYLDSPVETSVNGYLIHTGDRLILIDTGAANLFGPTLGKLLTNLEAAGYDGDAVDEVYLTHMHPDHLGGLITDGRRAFPNAIIRADQKDLDYWLSDESLAAASDDNKGFFEGARASLQPYIDNNQVQGFTGNTEFSEGISAQATYGHTPGHSVYVVQSNGHKLVFWGDLMHVATVQFEHPDITIDFDTDQDAAKAQRRHAYEDAARNGYLVAASHISFPGIGRIRLSSEGYQWLPVNYSPVSENE